MTGFSIVLPAGLGQRIALGAALLFYLGAILCAVALARWLEPLGGEHPVIASLAASIVFFVGGGIVLHVIGRASLPDLSPGLPRSDTGASTDPLAPTAARRGPLADQSLPAGWVISSATDRSPQSASGGHAPQHPG